LTRQNNGLCRDLVKKALERGVASKVEIERKFLVADPDIVAGLGGRRLLQGYLGQIGDFHLRLRLAGEEAWATLKSDAAGIARQEYEAPIPPALAARLLAACPAQHKIEKMRYRLRAGGQGLPALTWEIDQFLGRHAGLWLAEI
jgi:adenylate cyclase